MLSLTGCRCDVLHLGLVALMESDIILPVCGEVAMSILLDVMLFMDEPAICIELDSIWPICEEVILSMALVVMESDVILSVCCGLWPHPDIASESGRAREMNTSLHLVMFFIVFKFLSCVLC